MNDLAGPARLLRRAFAALLLALGATTAFAGDSPSTSPASTPTNGLDAVVAAGRAQADNSNDVLPPDQAFHLAAFADGPDRMRLIWQIADGYYLYRSRIKIGTTSGQAQLGAPQMPAGEIKQDDYFGKQEIYHHELSVSVPVARAAGSALDVPLSVTYQGCGRGICYPPIVKTLNVSLPTAGTGGGAAGLPSTSASGASPAGMAAKPARTPAAFVSDQDRYVSVLRDGNIVWVVLAFLGGGILLSFTPCVLPMVPIVSGIIIGDGTHVTARRSFGLSLAYVLGMALTYTAAGIAVAAGGQQVQAAFQQPWVIALFAALFVVLALSMFGLFTLQMPAAIQTRLATMSNRQSAGSYGGVAIMGALSSLIVTTCVGPALVGALLFIGQSGNMVRGGIALFSMAIGMGTPLLVVGASAGKLLPKAGPWMDLVKRLFGALMLAVAAWMLERIVSDRFSLLLWLVPSVAAAVVLWTGISGLRGGGVMFARIAGSAAALYAGVLVAGMIMGNTDPLSPLSRNVASARHDLPFRTIKSVADLQREVADARSQGKGVLLDFYADWCVSCKEMERYTFTDSTVQSVLQGTVLLRANVTANDADDQALLRHFGIYGPPTIALYGADGQERRNFRVVGYMKAADFANLLHQALAASAHTQQSAARASGTAGELTPAT